MQTRHYIAIALATVAVAVVLLAKAAHISLLQKCKTSDLIAVVEITATNRVHVSKQYQNVATAKVVEIIKGRIDDATFGLDYDDGLECPSVEYAPGERCLIFATRLPSGHFATYNSYYGKFIVINDTVVDWEYGAHSKLDAVRKEIRKHVE